MPTAFFHEEDRTRRCSYCHEFWHNTRSELGCPQEAADRVDDDARLAERLHEAAQEIAERRELQRELVIARFESKRPPRMAPEIVAQRRRERENLDAFAWNEPAADRGFLDALDAVLA